MRSVKQTDILTGSIPKQLLLFFLPIWFGTLFQQLYNTADTLIVGNFVGTQALAAVGATGAFVNLLVGLFVGLCSGVGVVVSQSFGARDYDGVDRQVHTALVLSVAIGALLTVLGLLTAEPMMHLMGTPAEILDDAALYLRIYFLGMIPQMLYNMGTNILRAIGDSKRPLYFLIAASLVNIALDVVFIAVFGWGVAGAAIATIAAQAVSGILCLIYIRFRVPLLTLSRADCKADAESIRDLVVMGIPMGLQYSITAIGSIVLQSAVNGRGTAAIASVAAGAKLFQLICCPYDAMGSSMATYCGQNVGACKLDRLGQGMRACAWLGLGYAVLAVGAMLLFAPQCAMLFLNQDEADLVRLVSLTSQYITTLTAFFFPLALVNIVRFSIQGMGFSQLSILAGVLEMAARTVMGQVFVPLFGFTAACFASPVAWISADLFLIPAAILCIRHLRKLYPDQTEEAGLRPVRAEGP